MNPIINLMLDCSD